MPEKKEVSYGAASFFQLHSIGDGILIRFDPTTGKTWSFKMDSERGQWVESKPSVWIEFVEEEKQ